MKPTSPIIHTAPRRQAPRWVRNRVRELMDSWGVSRDTANRWRREYPADVWRYDMPLARRILENPRIAWNENPRLAALRIMAGWRAGQEYLRRLDAQKLSTAETKTTIETSK